MNCDDHIETWECFEGLVSRFSSCAKIFRGQANSTWKLLPSLTRIFREVKIDTKEAIQIESGLLNTVQETISHPVYSKFNRNNKFLWWSLMQHYKVPTRLLDWSTDIRSALFFACCDEPEEDGALYFFDDGHLNFIRRIRHNESWPNFEKQLIKSLNGENYETSIYAFTTDAPIVRQLNQQGCFTISTEIIGSVEETHDLLADKLVFDGVKGGKSSSLLFRYIVPKKMKPIYLNELEKMGITKELVYPENEPDTILRTQRVIEFLESIKRK